MATEERDLGLPPVEVLVPPPIKEIPAQIPGPVQQADGSWVLSAELAEAVELSLIDYRRYPEKCQALLREQAEVGERRAEAAVSVALSECVVEKVEQRAELVEDAGMPVWEVVLIGVGAGVGGVLVGIVIGLVAGGG